MATVVRQKGKTPRGITQAYTVDMIVQSEGQNNKNHAIGQKHAPFHAMCVYTTKTRLCCLHNTLSS